MCMMHSWLNCLQTFRLMGEKNQDLIIRCLFFCIKQAIEECISMHLDMQIFSKNTISFLYPNYNVSDFLNISLRHLLIFFIINQFYYYVLLIFGFICFCKPYANCTGCKIECFIFTEWTFTNSPYLGDTC